MRTIAQIHEQQTQLESNIRFYSLEINFLLKTLTKEYAIKINNEKIKMLDSFWKEFEKYASRLKNLENKIIQQEHDLYSIYHDQKENIFKDETIAELIVAEYTAIIDELKLLKESLYDYISNSGN